MPRGAKSSRVTKQHRIAFNINHMTSAIEAARVVRVNVLSFNSVLPLNEGTVSRTVMVIVSGSDERVGGNVFGAG